MASGKQVKISLDDLEKVIEIVFQNIRKVHRTNEINLERDYYFTVLLNEKYPESPIDPNEIKVGMGQLYDDWEFLEPILSDPEQGVSLMFDHIAPLLRYIASQPLSEPDET